MNKKLVLYGVCILGMLISGCSKKESTIVETNNKQNIVNEEKNLNTKTDTNEAINNKQSSSKKDESTSQNVNVKFEFTKRTVKGNEGVETNYIDTFLLVNDKKEKIGSFEGESAFSFTDLSNRNVPKQTILGAQIMFGGGATTLYLVKDNNNLYIKQDEVIEDGKGDASTSKVNTVKTIELPSNANIKVLESEDAE